MENRMALNGQEKRFWTAKEAADYLGIATATLYSYVRYRPRPREQRQSIPPFRRIGRNVLRFPIIEFVEWANRFDMPEQEKK